MNDSFDAIYYSGPVPSSFETLTILSFIFDKIYFPGVYIPNTGIDEVETKKEIDRIKSLGVRSIERTQLVNCMTFSLHNKYLKDFCIFTGKFGRAGILEDGAKDMTMFLEELVFGPPPPNFTPTPCMGFAIGLPGNKEAAVNGPSWLSYPANALIYSMKNELPLVNDNPTLPVPALGGISPKSNAKLLSTILTIESINMVLPKLKALTPREIMEFREQTREYVKPFRLALLKLSKDLNTAIESDMSTKEVQKEARFLVETTVYPKLEELRNIIHDPSRPWYKRTIDLVKSSPELATNFILMPKYLAIAKLLAKMASTLAGPQDDKLDKEHKMNRSGFHYLLKIEERIST